MSESDSSLEPVLRRLDGPHFGGTGPQALSFAQALLAAQAQMENVGRDAKNEHFKNKYATLEAVMNVVRPALNANGILILTPTSFTRRQFANGPASVCETTVILVHKDGGGEQFLSQLFVKENATPQEQLSASTYNRRYCVMSLFALAPEDDDGNAASGKAAKPAKVDTEEQKVAVWRKAIEGARGNKEKLASARTKVLTLGFSKESTDKLIQLIGEVENG